jgi:hypothetical protein
MADTKRKLIVANILSALEAISIASGFETNLGSNISRWRLADYKATEGMGASVYDYEEASHFGENLSGPQRRKLKIEIEVKAPQVLDAPAEMLQAFADIETVIGANQDWGGLATKTVPAGNKLTVEQGTKKIAGGILSIEVHYVTQPFNPYQ